MIRTHRKKDLDQLQRIKRENEALKREVSSLRKQLSKIDLNRHSYIKDIVEEHLSQENEEILNEKELKSLKRAWACHDCGAGVLEIYIYSRQDGDFYYRICNNCSKRTRSQKYNPETVVGIIKTNPKQDKINK